LGAETRKTLKGGIALRGSLAARGRADQGRHIGRRADLAEDPDGGRAQARILGAERFKRGLANGRTGRFVLGPDTGAHGMICQGSKYDCFQIGSHDHQ